MDTRHRIVLNTIQYNLRHVLKMLKQAENNVNMIKKNMKTWDRTNIELVKESEKEIIKLRKIIAGSRKYVKKKG